MTLAKSILLPLLGCVLLIVSGLLAATVGAVEIPLASVWSLVTGDGVEPSAIQTQIITEIRLPRLVLAAVIGGSLATVGTALQSVMRNPLAEPYVLGVSSGAAVGAALVTVLGVSTWALGGLVLALAAFAMGLLSVAVVYLVVKWLRKRQAV